MIPAVAHFIWYGRSFPWAYALALVTAARRGGFDRVKLHHADALDDGLGRAALDDEPKVELVRLEPSAALEAVGPLGSELQRLYARLDAPAARANMMRAAILFNEGGVYLDTDTITVASLEPLRRDAAFTGLEHIVLPYTVRQTKNPLPWVRAGALMAMREAMRRLPIGHRVFPRVAPLYHAAANNAVLGAEPAHPFIGALLQGMADTPPERQLVRFALGTNLLQELVDGRGPGRDSLVLHEPAVFYPLGPEVSEHWFRMRSNADLAEVVAARTRVIHWYASVRTKQIIPKLDPDYVRLNAGRQLFSAAAKQALGD